MLCYWRKYIYQNIVCCLWESTQQFVMWNISFVVCSEAFDVENSLLQSQFKLAMTSFVDNIWGCAKSGRHVNCKEKGEGFCPGKGCQNIGGNKVRWHINEESIKVCVMADQGWRAAPKIHVVLVMHVQVWSPYSAIDSNKRLFLE